MSKPFGTVPKEPPVQRSLDVCAPAFARRVRALLRDLVGGPSEAVFETLRTPDRQAWLYGMGRYYDDGRGKVTNAAHGHSWHFFGAACDIVEKDATPWDAPPGFFEALGRAAPRHGLVWGGNWLAKDLPHVQMAGCPVTPTDFDRERFANGGLQAVWDFYGWND